ncbi:MAG TPA: plastocyanin/azurin family copper-binding protein [bacterium]|nr:plastocyanin/azurin family copper-binding protein [bacterium]
MRCLVGAGVVLVAALPEFAMADMAPRPVTIQTFQFQPAQIEIAAGTPVTWTNTDEIEHTVTSGTPEHRTPMFNASLKGPGAAFSVTFSKPGTYVYFCDRHHFMQGQITVK